MAIVQKAYQIISVLNESKREMQWNVRNAMGQKRNAEELNRMRKCNGYVKLEMWDCDWDSDGCLLLDASIEKKEGEKKREIEKGWFKSAEETTRAIRFLMGIVLFPQKSIWLADSVVEEKIKKEIVRKYTTQENV